MEVSHIVACQLILERCQLCLSHMYALLHLSEPGNPEQDWLASGNITAVLASLEQELRNGMTLLSRIG